MDVTGAPDPLAQHVGDGDDPGRPIRELMDAGLLWLINSSLFHPRGLALALHVDRTSGEVRGWSLKTAPPGEAYRYAVPCELDDSSKAPDLDAMFRAAETTLTRARLAGVYEPGESAIPDSPAHDCGHTCCDERSDPMHDHFLAPDTCPPCVNGTP